MLQLPRTPGCIACGPQNPHGLHLRMQVDPATARVQTTFIPEPSHIGFENVIHGGVLATVLDELMVWSATWKARRFCLCAELTTRFRHPVAVGQKLEITAEVEFIRPKLVEAVSKIFDSSGTLVATGSGKYIPMTKEQHQQFVKTLIEDPETNEATTILREGR